MASLVMAGVMMAWIKMGQAAAAVTLIFAAFFSSLAYKFSKIMSLFAIPHGEKVTGEVVLKNPGENEIDLSEIAPTQQVRPTARGAAPGKRLLQAGPPSTNGADGYDQLPPQIAMSSLKGSSSLLGRSPASSSQLPGEMAEGGERFAPTQTATASGTPRSVLTSCSEDDARDFAAQGSEPASRRLLGGIFQKGP